MLSFTQESVKIYYIKDNVIGENNILFNIYFNILFNILFNIRFDV